MSVTEWLLWPENPSVRYRTLVELLDMGSTEKALSAKLAIPESVPVMNLLKKMHPNGY